MAHYAQIDRGRVTGTINQAPTEAPAERTFVEAPDWVQGGESYAGGVFTAPPAPTVAESAAADLGGKAWAALLLYQARVTLGREPTAAERKAAREALVRAYQDVA